MSHPNRPHDGLPVLPFADLTVGRQFAEQQFAVTEELVSAYAALTGDDNPIYRLAPAARAAGLPGPVMPPGLAGIWARRSYLARHRMLPGGVMAGQTLAFTAAVPVGEVLTLSASVAEHDPADPKRRVLLDCRARLADGTAAGHVQIDARWPEGNPS
jgi:acyl dehydratase